MLHTHPTMRDYYSMWLIMHSFIQIFDLIPDDKCGQIGIRCADFWCFSFLFFLAEQFYWFVLLWLCASAIEFLWCIYICKPQHSDQIQSSVHCAMCIQRELRRGSFECMASDNNISRALCERYCLISTIYHMPHCLYLYRNSFLLIYL